MSELVRIGNAVGVVFIQITGLVSVRKGCGPRAVAPVHRRKVLPAHDRPGVGILARFTGEFPPLYTLIVILRNVSPVETEIKRPPIACGEPPLEREIPALGPDFPQVLRRLEEVREYRGLKQSGARTETVCGKQ